MTLAHIPKGVIGHVFLEGARTIRASPPNASQKQRSPLLFGDKTRKDPRVTLLDVATPGPRGGAFADALPTINACLNATSAILIFAGRRAAARHEADKHKRLMLSALLASSVFLALYLTRFYLTGTHRFVGADVLRYAYLAILFSHMILAVLVVPLVFRSIFLGLKGRIDEHRRIVRFTYPIWAYVSITGVVVYVMLYHLSGR